MTDQSKPREIKALDPCALATITCGTMLCEQGFGAVHEAAEWLMGHPVWTHEFIDPKIQAGMIHAVTSQFPDMPTSTPKDWRATVADLRARYGETVDVARGGGVRDRDPVETALGLGVPRENILIMERSDEP